MCKYELPTSRISKVIVIQDQNYTPPRFAGGQLVVSMPLRFRRITNSIVGLPHCFTHTFVAINFLLCF